MGDHWPMTTRKKVLGTSSENETPRTMIKTLLNVTSISQSTRLGAKKRPSVIKSPLISPPQKKRSLRKSIGDDMTPRTMLKNFLTEASPETPLEIPSSMNQVSREGGEDQRQDDIDQAAYKEGNFSLSLSKEASPEKISEKYSEFEERDIIDQAVSIVSEASPENLDTCSPQPTSGNLEESNDIQTRECNSVNEDLLEVTDSVMKQWNKSKWKDLVTPHLPVTKRRVLHEGSQIDENLDQSREKHPTKNRKRLPANKPATTKRKPSSSTSLPSSLVKSMFEHFSRSRVNNDTLQIIEKGSELFFKQLSSDLMAYCQHAGRTTIETRDVELLMKRHGFITSKQSLNSLIEKYLPMEYRQELIPVAQSGNKLLLKKSS